MSSEVPNPFFALTDFLLDLPLSPVVIVSAGAAALVAAVLLLA